MLISSGIPQGAGFDFGALFIFNLLTIYPMYRVMLSVFCACTYFTLFSIWFRVNLLTLNAKNSNFVIFHALHRPITDFVNVPDVLHIDLHNAGLDDFVKFLGSICHILYYLGVSMLVML